MHKLFEQKRGDGDDSGFGFLGIVIILGFLAMVLLLYIGYRLIQSYFFG